MYFLDVKWRIIWAMMECADVREKKYEVISFI